MKNSSFAEILDAAGNLRVDEREELVELLQKRTIEERRAELVKDIKNARSDYKNRKYSVASAQNHTCFLNLDHRSRPHQLVPASEAARMKRGRLPAA